VKNTILLFKALSDPSRLRVVAALMEYDELCACQITELLGFSGATVSRHLSLLVNAEILSSRKEGRWVYYKLQKNNFDLLFLLEWLKNRFQKIPVLQNDILLLKEIAACDTEEICKKQRYGSICSETGGASESKSFETKKKILFLCTGNSCRSQMAEGWVRYLLGDHFEAYSAGIEVHGLNQNALKVMAEAGVDISSQYSKYLDELRHINFDLVVTVCDHAHETCPIFPSKARIHAGFSDPPKMAAEIKENGGTEQEQLDCYRRVRDEIRAFVESLPELMNK
jgi:arsenate reductase